MKQFLTAIFLFTAISGLAQNIDSQKIDIVAHRGFWKTEATSFSENSIASLKEACTNNFRGCELDIHITSDGVIIVNHDPSISGKKIASHPYIQFEHDLLPNGEKRPVFDDYLAVASQYPSTMLVVEFKDSENGIVEKTIELLKKHSMYSNDRVMFISFSLAACERVASLCPGFTNQYLNGDLSPEEVLDKGINGIDYQYNVFKNHPEWVSQAHELGMSVNVWTVNSKKVMKKMVRLGVDAITTNEPLLLRSILKERENRLPHR